MGKVQDFFNSTAFKKVSQSLLVLLVIAIVVMSSYIFYKKGSEHYAPNSTCISSIQAYNSYQCSGDQITNLTGKNKVQLLKDIMDNCPEGISLGSYSCGPVSADVNILGGTQIGNRTPKFFPNQNWDHGVRGSNRNFEYGLYGYKRS